MVHPSERGHLKQALVKLGWPAEDVAGYVDGERHSIALDTTDWQPRDYQVEAADGFWYGGSGVVVLPCGAGKTIVGALAMSLAQATTLILVTNTVAARQWREELLRRTDTHPRRDRRVLRIEEGDSSGHHRDVPSPDQLSAKASTHTSRCSIRGTGA